MRVNPESGACGWRWRSGGERLHGQRLIHLRQQFGRGREAVVDGARLAAGIEDDRGGNGQRRIAPRQFGRAWRVNLDDANLPLALIEQARERWTLQRVAGTTILAAEGQDAHTAHLA